MDATFIYLVSALSVLFVIGWIAIKNDYVVSRFFKDNVIYRIKSISQRSLAIENKQDVLTKMSFEEIIGGSQLMETMSDTVMEDINKTISGRSVGLADSMIKGIEYIQESNEYIVKFSKEGQKLLKSDAAKLVKKKSGKLIPQLKRGGKFVEHAELTGKGRKVLKNLSKVSTLAIGIAHIISGADMAKKMDKLLDDTGFIIADRENERMAELEAIYKTIKEMLLENNGTLSPKEVYQYTHKLYKLRSNWRRNIEHKLKQIKNPKNKFWVKRIFTRKSDDKKVYKEISNCMSDFQKVRSSLYLQLAICYETDSLQNFQANMLESEIKDNERTLELLKSKGDYISGNFKNEGITSTNAIKFFESHINEQKALQIGGQPEPLKEIKA